jgi:hypothetical protein
LAHDVRGNGGLNLEALALGQSVGTEHAALEPWRAIHSSLDTMPEQRMRDIIKYSWRGMSTVLVALMAYQMI